MRTSQFGRVLIPLLTPFTKEFDIHHKKIYEEVDFLIANNRCDTLIIAGTNGEFYTLKHEERIQLFKTAKDATKGRLPLIAGTGANDTLEVIALSREAESLGYDALMILPPYFGNPTQDEIADHFWMIAEAVSLPIIIYNIPLFTGVNIRPATTARLAQNKQFIGIKEEAGVNPLQSTDTLLCTRDDFVIFCGDDVMTLQVLIQGGSGVVSGGSHIVGDLMKEQIDSFLSGDVAKAHEIYIKTFPFFKALVQGDRANPVPLTKAAMRLAGIDIGDPRPPLRPASDTELQRLHDAMANLGRIKS